MKRTHWCAVFLACLLAAPSFGQQKIFNWVPGGDETVSLDAGYYHGGPTFESSAKATDVRVDVDAQQPVRIYTVAAQEWINAAQRPDALQGLKTICVQEHVVKATYTCAPPEGMPVVVVIRDERLSESGSSFGEVIARHDRTGQDVERASSALLAERRVHEFVSPNNVHLQYYESCNSSCTIATLR